MEKDQKMEGKYGFLSSKVLWKDLSICNMNIQRETLTRKVKDFDHKLIPAVMASFVSLFLKAAVVKEVGLPIKDFFIWTDDWEYTRVMWYRKAWLYINRCLISVQIFTMILMNG